MAGTLQQLRRAIIDNEPITVDDEFIIINESIRLDRSSLTNFLSFQGRRQAYSLETIYFQYTFRDLPYNDYLQQCQKKRVEHVILIDKKDVIAYLTGRIDSCAAITTQDISNNISSVNTTNGTNSSSKSIPPSSSSLNKNSSSGNHQPNNIHGKDDDGDGGGGDDDKDKLTSKSYRLRVRDQRSIDSVLIVKDRDFSTLRDKLSQHVSAAKKGKLPTNNSSQKQQQQQQQPHQSSASRSNHSNNAIKNYDPRGDRYTSNEDRFWRENLGSDFQDTGIDMSGSFKAKPTPSTTPTPSSSNKNNTPSNSQRSSRSSQSQSQSQLNNHHSRNSSSRPSTSIRDPPISKRPKVIDPKTAVPIIIVPAGMSSLIFPANSKKFFEHGQFMSVNEMREKKLAMTHPTRFTIRRTPGGNCSSAHYHIVSHTNKLTTEEWENQVVAVILTGQAWQFKQWPIFKGQTIELFKKVQGFYFHYDDAPPTGDVNMWSVRKLAFQRDKRHNDGQILSQFWNILDGFISRNRLPLRY